MTQGNRQPRRYLRKGGDTKSTWWCPALTLCVTLGHMDYGHTSDSPLGGGGVTCRHVHGGRTGWGDAQQGALPAQLVRRHAMRRGARGEVPVQPVQVPQLAAAAAAPHLPGRCGGRVRWAREVSGAQHCRPRPPSVSPPRRPSPHGGCHHITASAP